MLSFFGFMLSVPQPGRNPIRKIKKTNLHMHHLTDSPKEKKINRFHFMFNEISKGNDQHQQQQKINIGPTYKNTLTHVFLSYFKMCFELIIVKIQKGPCKSPFNLGLCLRCAYFHRFLHISLTHQTRPLKMSDSTVQQQVAC